MTHERIQIPIGDRSLSCVVLRPKRAAGPLPGVLWIHGGGYVSGFAGMVNFTCGRLLAQRFDAVVISPGYRLAWKAPYPAALEDCWSALTYLWDHADELGVDRERVVVGGESAGGGLAAALCLYAREQGTVKIALQLPLYPMLDCRDTATSRDNHGRVWNTRRNHWGWKRYLRGLYGADDVPPFASPARATDYRGLPPCYTYVCEGEPFYQETMDYVKNLRAAGIWASVDVYPGDVHAFDLTRPWRRESREAKEELCRVFEERLVNSQGSRLK